MGDEHPPFNFQIAQYYVAKRINAILNSGYWKNSVIFMTYDEGGGYFDHVPPPRACVPDGIPPKLGKNDKYVASFDRLGFRVPFVAISPFVKRHHVSHTVYDHTSVLKYIESKFNVPALTMRDANANDMSDLFDYAHPNYSIPTLPKARINAGKLLDCLSFRKVKKPDPDVAALRAAAKDMGVVETSDE
jgi:phospholipase C